MPRQAIRVKNLLPTDNGGVSAVPHLFTYSAPDAVQTHTKGFELTTASVMALQMPEPPPVQKRTLPLKMSSLNTDVELTAGGSTYGLYML